MPHDSWVLLKSLALVPQNPLEVGGTGAPVLFVAWTLQYEMFFYTFFALLILSRWAAVVGAICVSALYLGCLISASCSAFPLSFLSSDYLPLFAMGMAVAVLAKHREVKKPLFYLLAGVAFFVLVSADKILHIDQLTNWKTLLFGLASSMMVFVLMQFRSLGFAGAAMAYVLTLACCIAAAMLIHLWVEKPMGIFFRSGMRFANPEGAKSQSAKAPVVV